MRKITKVNDELPVVGAIFQSLRNSLRSADGTQVQSWIMVPGGDKEGASYPLALEIHGGAFGIGYVFTHEFQLLASRGYGRYYCNPRVASGRSEVDDSDQPRLGGVDYQDIMAAVDYAAKLPWVDSSRMGVMGGSYAVK